MLLATYSCYCPRLHNANVLSAKGIDNETKGWADGTKPRTHNTSRQTNIHPAMTTQLSETILSNLGGIEHNLISILDIDTNEITQMPPSLYFEIDELKTLRNTTGANKQLSILSMNIQSIHAKFISGTGSIY